jgi:hypothetical protein
MQAKDIRRMPDRKRDARLQLREVVRDLDGRPHVFLRLRLTGFYFPPGALAPFMMVGDVVSRFASSSADGLTVTAYFDQPLPQARIVTLGYGNVAVEDFNLEVDTRALSRLDRERLPRGVIDPFA